MMVKLIKIIGHMNRQIENPDSSMLNHLWIVQMLMLDANVPCISNPSNSIYKSDLARWCGHINHSNLHRNPDPFEGGYGSHIIVGSKQSDIYVFKVAKTLYFAEIPILGSVIGSEFSTELI